MEARVGEQKIDYLAAILYAEFRGLRWHEGLAALAAMTDFNGRYLLIHGGIETWRRVARAAAAHADSYREREDRISMLDAEIGVPAGGLAPRGTPAIATQSLSQGAPGLNVHSQNSWIR